MNIPRRRLSVAALLSAAITASLTACDVVPPGSTAALGVPVVDVRPTVPGYQRSCRQGRACSFGPAWSDNTAVAGGRNGCDTRNDILRRDLTRVQIKAGTRGCKVVGGVLQDPYTGQAQTFTADTIRQVEVDHLVPLAAAWDLGAAEWTQQRRVDFANDPRNLKAVTQESHRPKRDQTVGAWVPAHDPCRYVHDYSVVVMAYQLAITRADAAAFARCAVDGAAAAPGESDAAR